MAQYPIPQFIEQEAKIISFLTFRQFFILVGGGAVCFVLYFILPFSFFIIAFMFVAAITAAIGFLKVNNASVLTILFQYIGFSAGAKNYIWKKKSFSYPLKMKNQPNMMDSKTLVDLTLNPSKLKDIKKNVELKKQEAIEQPK